MDLVTLALAKSYTDEVVEENGGAGSVAQVQADWNQSDETAVDFIKNRPFYVETLPYFNGNNKISITNWETVEDPDMGTRHYSSEHITEENFLSFPAVGDKFIIKTNGSDSYKEQELICCYSKAEGNGGFFILGNSGLAIDAGYVDECDITTYSNYAIKCTRVTEPAGGFEDFEVPADYGKIQMVFAFSEDHPTEIELFGPTKITTIPDKFIPAQVPNVKIYANPGQILAVKSVDEEWSYPSEWELIDLPSSDNYATKKYVDDAIATALANLGIAEEGAY